MYRNKNELLIRSTGCHFVRLVLKIYIIIDIYFLNRERMHLACVCVCEREYVHVWVLA